MAEGIDAASFEFYEGIRIFIPGAIAVGMAGGVGVTFDVKWLDPTGNTLAAVVASLLVGLVFYFVDAPARSAVIRPLQPTEILRSWGVRGELSTLNTYLLLLDTEVPPAIRARALYMGSMFRIGFEAIFLLVLGGLAVVLSPIAIYEVSEIDGGAATPTRMWLMAGVLGCWLFAVWRHRQQGSASRPAATSVGDVPTVTTSRVDYALLAVASAVYGVLFLRHDHVQSRALLVPCVALATLWAVRYFRGYAPLAKGTSRRPVDAVHAVLLASVPVLMGMGSQFLNPPRARHMSLYEEVAWDAVMLVGLLLITARGHERRLRGAYSSQNSWLVSSKSRILQDHYGVTAAVVKPEPPTTTGR
jgi:hypothetical protein